MAVKTSAMCVIGSCVEVDLDFKKSTASFPIACVEVAQIPDEGVAVRDSKLGDNSPVLVFNQQEWRAFITGVKAGEFDLS